MLGGKAQNQIRPVALGATVNSGAYGQTIPLLYGMTKGAAYLIWMANMRQGSAKKAKKTKGPPDYVANVDWLMAHNPIATILQAWINQNQWLILNFAKYTLHSSFIGGATLTVPDTALYAVVAVTVTVPYDFNYTGSSGGSVTFDDYGAQGSSTLSGNYEIPLWNAAYNGPDPVHSSGQRNSPWAYWWTPAAGRTIQLPYAALGMYPIGGYDINVYYAQIPSFNEINTNALQTALGLNGQKASADTPVGAMNLIFEPSLGDGPEFQGTDNTSGNPLDDQQIIYPHYAGAGSEAFAMGSSQTFPEFAPELLGTFPVNPSGPFTGTTGDGSGVDADFADMVEDLFYGATQAGFGNDNPQTPIQHGLNCGQRPGTMQQADYIYEPALASGGGGTFAYNLPNVAGDWLVVIAGAGDSSGAMSISDTAGNTWTALFAGAANFQVWYAQAKAYNHNGQGTTVTVTIPWFGLATNQITLLEIAGVDTFDASATAAGATASITTTGVQGTPEYILAIADYSQLSGGGAVPPVALWQNLLNPDVADLTVLTALCREQYRVVQFPGTYQYTAHTVGASHTPAHVALLAFKCSQPPNYPPALGNVIGDILDKPSLQIVRNQCRAAGLWGSLFLDSQVRGSDILGQLYEAMDAWPVWSGFSLKSIARSEVSAVGNGAVYNAPTAAGPIVDLVESDFITSSPDTPPVTVTRKAQVNVPDILSVSHPNRASQYNEVNISEPESGAVALYGPRKDSPKRMPMFQSPAVSRMYLDIQVRLADLVRNQTEFTLNAKWKLFEPGDLVTVPVASMMPNTQGPGGTVPVPYVKVPVRLLSCDEDKDLGLKCTAEPFIYGCYAPLELPATQQQGYIPKTGAPGSVNIPVLFEPVPRLAGGNTQPELWLAVSGGAAVGSPPVIPDYGGCFVYVSTDGGNSYQPVAPLVQGGSVVGGNNAPPSNALLGNATTGWLTQPWAAHPSPDSTNDLIVDLSECHGTLDSYSATDEDAFTYPCLVTGAATSPLYQQSCSTAAVSASTASKIFPLSNNPGNAILLIIATRESMPLGVNVSDSNGNSYGLLFTTSAVSDFGVYSKVYVYAALNIVSGGNTVTVSFQSGTGEILFAALEYSDLATTGSPPSVLPFTFSFNQAIFGGAFTISSGAYPVNQPGSLVIAFGYDAANNQNQDPFTITPHFAWNLRENPSLPLGSDQSQLAVWDVAVPLVSAQNDTLAGPDGQNAIHFGAIALPPSGNQVTGIPYELMTYALAELVGTEIYALKALATGSPPVGNHLDRGVFGCPAPNQGVFHQGPIIPAVPLSQSGTSRFCFVGPPYTGIMRLALDPTWIGKTLYFKFAAFNSNIAQVQDLADCTPYAYTPTGAAGSASGNPSSYSVTPTPAGSPPVAPSAALSNPTATTIDMAQVTANFPSNTVVYNARVFTIPAPSVPTTYYVTITDPGYTGDSPGQTNLVGICQTSAALVGVPGNTYIGSIVALPGGGGTVVGPGGSSGFDSFELLVNGA